MNWKVVQYLATAFDLLAGTVSSYMKPNTILKYVKPKSSHPENVIKHILMGAECRLSRNSSTKEISEEQKKEYIAALKGEDHNIDLKFKPTNKEQQAENKKSYLIQPTPSSTCKWKLILGGYFWPFKKAFQ